MTNKGKRKHIKNIFSSHDVELIYLSSLVEKSSTYLRFSIKMIM